MPCLLLLWACTVALALCRTASGDYVSTDYDTYNDGSLGHRPHLEYHSSREFSPILQANIWDRDYISPSGSHIFLRHDGNDTSPLSSPLILDASDLSAVFMNRTFKNVFGTRIQENFGKKYLTFWEGEKGNGIGDGYGLAYDENYRLAYKVWAQNIQVHSDLHEFAFTGNGSALVTGVNMLRLRGSDYREDWNLPHRFDVLDAILQEIDLETNEVIFDWRALDHINPMESSEPRGSGWDAYHMNSIEKTQAGNYLVSIRHIHSILLINGKTGDIIWTLGGVHNDFVELPPAEGLEDSQPLLSMRWQHHARFVPGTNETQMTFFDNHVKITSHEECISDCSRGLHIAINDAASPPTVQLLQEFHHPSRLQAQSQGSVQPLSPTADDIGNVFIGWGRCPTFTEHNSSGAVVMDVQFSPWHSLEIPDALDNYRAYKMNWSATPWWPPAIAPRQNTDGDLVVYVSWNGATEVAEWIVRGAVGYKAHNIGSVLAKSRRTGFETKLTIGQTVWRYLWAEAVDSHGNVLGVTEIVDLDTTELSVASDLYNTSETAISPLERKPSKASASKLSSTQIALLATGLGVLVLGIIAAGIITWRRRSDYNHLDAEDFDLGLDEDDHSDNEGDDTDSYSADLNPHIRGHEEDSHALLPRQGEKG
ncbi:hypothetical protein N7462_001686 [Penicillium macrosclerotiorum]|uniref:uncharacterized protein n=1 Tax=Penicillium macrosclerotiorum TaxID=303699 RepID=UPI0025488122|nr:uncharacterized protein N7462_001686 [Penicillium macrosclerotiorum]KAJ5692263.1 hypothetical protein N7462_001686 [Penicillium macrosclerotiorum]